MILTWMVITDQRPFRSCKWGRSVHPVVHELYEVKYNQEVLLCFLRGFCFNLETLSYQPIHTSKGENSLCSVSLSYILGRSCCRLGMLCDRKGGHFLEQPATLKSWITAQSLVVQTGNLTCTARSTKIWRKLTLRGAFVTRSRPVPYLSSWHTYRELVLLELLFRASFEGTADVPSRIIAATAI